MTGVGPPSRPGGAATALLLSLILIAAAWLRVAGLDWDEGTYLHPDERFLAFVHSSVDTPDSLRAYLDTAGSPLNPNNRGHAFFPYGQLPVTLVHLLGERFDGSGRWERFAPLGRAVSAASDALTVLLTFLIGCTLYGRAAGLLAAAGYGLAVAPIQQAHFATVDALGNCFVTAAFWFAARAAQQPRWRDDVLFGLAAGAALASKVSALPVVLLLPLALAARSAAPPATRAALRPRLARAVASANLAGIVALLVFRLLQPYAFLAPYAGIVRPPSADAITHLTDRVADVALAQINPAWLAQMDELSRLMRGEIDQPPNHQWASRTPFLFPWLSMVRFGLGWPLGLAAWAAWTWASIELLGRRPGARRHLLPVAWVGLVFAWYGSRWVMKIGYLLPIYPALMVLAGWGLHALWRGEPGLGRQASPRRRALGLAALAVVGLGSAAWAAAFTRIYARPHPRLAATRWIVAEVPGDITLALDGGREVRLGLPNGWPPPTADGQAAPTRSRLDADDERAVPFVAPAAGPLIGIGAARLAAAPDGPPATRLRLSLRRADDLSAVAACDLVGPFALDGGPAACQLAPVSLAPGTPYQLHLRSDGGALLAGGARVAVEGEWDDAVPMALDGADPWGALYENLALQSVWPDTEAKRAHLQTVLDRADYLVLSSNRLYDSLRRNPRRWPMTIAFYRGLFSGALGFAPVADFASLPGLGPWWVDDSGAEEAFTVYDHPRVLVFRKTDAYRADRTAAILAAADLAAVEPLRADQVTDPPADLGVPPPRSATGGIGG